MPRSPLYYLTLIIVVVVALKLMVLFLEPRMAFVPFRGLDVTPSAYGIPFQQFTVNTVDGERIVGWHLDQPDASLEVVYFHGNGGNLSMWSDVLAGIHSRGIAVTALDYRGYGTSSGSPSETGLYRDTDAFVRDFQTRLHQPHRAIVYWGRSLGATVAAYATSVAKPDGLILEAGFPSVGALLTHYPVMKFLSMFSSYRFPTVDFLQGFDRPVLVIHGDADRIVPYSQGRALFEQIQGDKEFVTLRGVDHNDLQAPTAGHYWTPLARFMEKVVKKRSSD